MGNPLRGMYWALRKQGLSDSEARARVKEHFKGGSSTRSAKKSKRKKKLKKRK